LHGFGRIEVVEFSDNLLKEEKPALPII